MSSKKLLNQYLNDKINIEQLVHYFDVNNYTEEEIKDNGIVYTPKYISDYIVELLKPNLNESIFEPSVGYGVDNSLDRDQRVKQWSDYKQNIINCFNKTIEEVSLKPDLLINLNHKPELLLTEAGDFALHYTVSFYLKNIDKSMNTETARNYIRTKEKWNELFLDNCVEYGVDLSTPILYSKV